MCPTQPRNVYLRVRKLIEISIGCVAAGVRIVIERKVTSLDLDEASGRSEVLA